MGKSGGASRASRTVAERRGRTTSAKAYHQRAQRHTPPQRAPQRPVDGGHIRRGGYAGQTRPNAPKRAAPTRPIRPEPRKPAGQMTPLSEHANEKLTLTRAQQQDYKELKSKQGAYEKQARVYDKLAARATTRGDTEGRRFYALMSHAAKSQLGVLADYNRKASLLKSERARLRAEADARKTREMIAGKQGRPTAAQGSTLAWARANPDAVGAYHPSADPALDRLAAEKGYTTKPFTATKSQMDRLVDELGAHEFYRGFASRSHIKQGGTVQEATTRAKGYARDFQRGAYRASSGTYGSGYYVAHGEGARATAHEYGGAMLAPHRGGVALRGAIIPGARLIGAGEAKRQMEREGNAFLRAHGLTPTRQPSEHFTLSEPDAAISKLAPADRGEYTLHYGDVGRWATWKGYDALGGPGSRYWVILNRGAVITQRSLEKPSARVVRRGDTSSPRRQKKSG